MQITFNSIRMNTLEFIPISWSLARWIEEFVEYEFKPSTNVVGVVSTIQPINSNPISVTAFSKSISDDFVPTH